MAIPNNIKVVQRAWSKKMAEVDIRARVTRDQLMLELISLSKKEIKGRRPAGQKATPGQPPMNRTGTLRRSITGERFRSGFASYSALVGPTVIYGRALEVANQYAPPSWTGAARTKGFPFMEPAYIKFRYTATIITQRNYRGL